MLITLGPIVLDVDVAATRRFYETGRSYVPCTCDGCRNFDVAVHHMPPVLLDALRQLGVDPAKPAEQWVNCATPDGKGAQYGGFYNVCGTIVKAAEHWRAPDFELLVSDECSLLKPDFPRPCFEVDFYCTLPWLLEISATDAYPAG